MKTKGVISSRFGRIAVGLAGLIASTLPIFAQSPASASSSVVKEPTPVVRSVEETVLRPSLGSFGSLELNKAMFVYHDKINYQDTPFGKSPDIERLISVALPPSAGRMQIRPFNLISDETGTVFTTREDRRVVLTDTNKDGVLNRDDRDPKAKDSKTVFVDKDRNGVLDFVSYQAGGFTTDYNKAQVESDFKDNGSKSYQELFKIMSVNYLDKELNAALDAIKNGARLIGHVPSKRFAFESLTSAVNESVLLTYTADNGVYSFSMRFSPVNSRHPLSFYPRSELDKYSAIRLEGISEGSPYYDSLKKFGEDVDAARSTASKAHLTGLANSFFPAKN